jgi:adenylate kinase family enzyme
MKTIELLFIDHQISETKVHDALHTKFDLNSFKFSEKIREQLSESSALSNEFNTYLKNGEVIPTEIIEKFIKSKIIDNNYNNVLMSGYPKNHEQYVSLKKTLSDFNYKLSCIWYFKQRNSKDYQDEFLNSPELKPWFEKYGEEMDQQWENNYTKKRVAIENILMTIKDIKINVVEIDYREKDIELYILTQINNCT